MKKRNDPLPKGQIWVQIKPQYWHEWGCEPRGKVSTFAYDKWGDYHFTGYMPKAMTKDLKFLNPFA